MGEPHTRRTPSLHRFHTTMPTLRGMGEKKRSGKREKLPVMNWVAPDAPIAGRFDRVSASI